MTDEVVLPSPCLVVLVGPSGAGKSTWASTHFADDQIVSSDHLRAVVAGSEDDLSASEDAFELLELIVAQRIRRRLPWYRADVMTQLQLALRRAPTGGDIST